MIVPSGQTLHQVLLQNMDRPKKNVKIDALRTPTIHGTVRMDEFRALPTT
jgi:hypothetical protein